MAKQSATSIQELRALADRPEEQARLAVTLLRPKQQRQVVEAALNALRRYPLDAAREPLLTLYGYLTDVPEKRDPGGYLRRPILDALRPLVRPDDLPLLLAAVETYERYPPGFQEEAGLVRAAGLVVLNEVDETLARYHAARLLGDLAHADKMSGEPAVTAIDVLAAHGDLLPLYLVAMLPVHTGIGEVTAECLRQLTALPAPLIEPLLAHYADCEDPLILIGIFDLLLGHDQGAQGEDFIADFLARDVALDLYQYLATALVASGRPELVDLLIESLRWETDRARRSVAREALLLRAEEPRVAEALARLD